ncbi:DUF805 domain-containing protein [Bosea lathyri]|uniref:Uncharacterized membrane protein YhaH, DUF805 family n=1 Tax=Bosea lathyri TaxID=1036778 RepID=A0A1H5SGN7_9HYPH|nr:DUF805 domain-containing protein [Bosea lathyri]SEF49779.1 Uncharacterized membrane protein YhaH, DUF805 family [Bosea lathyri]
MSLFRLLTDFDGRIGLARFWLGSALVAVLLLAIQQGAPVLFGRNASHVLAFANAFALFPWAALAAKRANDRGSTALFGILLICAIVLPGHLRPFLPFFWGPSLHTISLVAWLIALVDLGLLPSLHDKDRVAAAEAGAKAGAWTRPNAPSPISVRPFSIPPTPSP